MSPRQIVHAFVFFRRYKQGKRPAEFLALKKFLKEDDVVFDIGAHAGTWAVPLGQTVPKGKVYAFEALPYYAGILGLTMKLHGRLNVVVINEAVSNERKTLELVWKDTTGKRLTGKTHLASTKDDSPHRVQVQSVRLDDFVRDRKIDRLAFIKIDIEGAEMMAYEGAVETLKKFQPLIFSEVRNQWCERYGHTRADVLNFLANLGYKGYTIEDDGSFAPAPEVAAPGKDDVFFVPTTKAAALGLPA